MWLRMAVDRRAACARTAASASPSIATRIGSRAPGRALGAGFRRPVVPAARQPAARRDRGSAASPLPSRSPRGFSSGDRMAPWNGGSISRGSLPPQDRPRSGSASVAPPTSSRGPESSRGWRGMSCTPRFSGRFDSARASRRRYGRTSRPHMTLLVVIDVEPRWFPRSRHEQPPWPPGF